MDTNKPNLREASISAAIQAEIGEQCTQPSTMEKCKNGKVRDGSLQSTMPPPERRNCVQIVEKPPESLPSSGKRNLLDFKHPVFNDLPPSEQKRLQKFRDMFGPSWPRCHMENCLRDAEQMGEDPYIAEWKQSMISKGRAVKDYTSCCSNPFEPLDFKANVDLYGALCGFGKKAVADFNSKCNKNLNINLSFHDIENVTSCFSSCKHHLVTIKVVDPRDKINELVLRGILNDGGFAEAKVEEFVLLSACKREALVT